MDTKLDTKLDTASNTSPIIKVGLITQNIDVDSLINEYVEFVVDGNADVDVSDNLQPNIEVNDNISITAAEIEIDIDMDMDMATYKNNIIDITKSSLDNKQLPSQIPNQTPNAISTYRKIISSILELYRKYGTTIIDKHYNNTLFNRELVSKSLTQYSIGCAINTCNSREIIFYNDSNRNLITVVAFLSNLGFVLLNTNKNESSETDSYCVPDNVCENPYKLASAYLKNIGMPDTICNLVEHILEIKIYNSRKAISAGVSSYYDNQLECVKALIDSNNLGYDADNFKDIEKIENFELLMAIDKCMHEHVGNCRENEIDLYLNGFIKPNMIGVMG